MTVGFAPAPVTTEPEAKETPDVVHWVCCCTDNNTAACGLDMTGHEFTDDYSITVCIVCDDLWGPGRPCPFCHRLCCS